MTPRTVVAAALLALACAGGRGPGRPIPQIVEQAPDEGLLNLVAAALAADARLEPAAGLYAGDAVTVANGEVRHYPPRYAGIAPGGVVGVTSSRIEVRPTIAWALVEYRWVSTAEGVAVEGVASFVLVPAERGEVGWRIRHAHSSAPPA